MVRQQSVSSAIHSAIAGIGKELDGVKSRYRAAQDAAASLCGTDVSDAFNRDPKSADVLKVEEKNHCNAERRMRELIGQRDELLRLGAHVEEMFSVARTDLR
jgi:hypothetical protein